MSWVKKDKSTRTFVFAIAVMGLVTTGLWFGAQFNSTQANTNNLTLASAPAATFGGANLGAIPDAPSGNCWGAFVPTPRNVTFNVTGVTGPPSNVELSMTSGAPEHTWVGDVRATLIAPNGASHTIFGRTGATTSGGSGDSSNLAGPYNFKDSAVGTNWWTAAANETTGTAPVVSGDYRTTTAGGVAGAGTNTSINPAFAGVANPTGTWTLRLEDGCAGDSGSISAATLTVDGTTPATPAEANVDFDGDGKSDYTVARDNSPPPAAIETFNNEFFRAESVREKLRIQAEQTDSAAPENHGTSISWYIQQTQSNSPRVQGFGTAATDFLVPNDYNVNGRDDIAVWRPGAPGVAAFYILNATNNTIREEFFGQTGDDTAITGDYDGDGIADLASYRCPAIGTGDGQCFFYYKGSLNNPMGNITYIPWGFGEQFDFFVNPGDFDGDGKFDFCIQRTDPASAGSGQFILLKSGGGAVEYINWGRDSDLIVPGDYDGDGKYDFCVSRTETIGGNPGRSYYILERDGGGTGASPIRWGIAGDVRTPGDYDGDGKTDIAIWRPSMTPNMSIFYVRRSSDGALQSYQWGQSGDFAVAAWVVH